MTAFAIKRGATVFVLDTTQVRWFEYNERYGDLTIFFHNGAMETIRSRNIYKVYQDLMLQFNVLDVDKY
jgi:hypothetical protein